MFNWVNSTVRKGSACEMQIFRAFKFQNVVAHAHKAKIRPNFHTYLKKAKRLKSIFVAKPLAKTAECSQFVCKKV